MSVSKRVAVCRRSTTSSRVCQVSDTLRRMTATVAMTTPARDASIVVRSLTRDTTAAVGRDRTVTRTSPVRAGPRAITDGP